MPKVSVIIPVFNAKEHIHECINSILSQTFRDLEIIIVDDGSTDETLSIVDSIDSELVNVVHQENRGVSSARNAGILSSSGEYLCFVDSDDILEPEFLENLLSVGQFDIVFGNCKLLFEGGKTVLKEGRVKPGEYHSFEFYDKCIDDGTVTGTLFGNVWGALYKASLIKENGVLFREDLRVNEDGVFNIELLKCADRLCVSPFCNYLYRQWKSDKKEELSFDSTELDKATEVIEMVCADFSNYKTQLFRRKISVLFWVLLRIRNVNMGVFRLSKEVKRYCDSVPDVSSCYKYLDFDKMTYYKKFLVRLIMSRHYFLFSFIVKKIIPHLEKRINH